MKRPWFSADWLSKRGGSRFGDSLIQDLLIPILSMIERPTAAPDNPLPGFWAKETVRGKSSPIEMNFGTDAAVCSLSTTIPTPV
jgi:hypothetical protein